MGLSIAKGVPGSSQRVLRVTKGGVRVVKGVLRVTKGGVRVVKGGFTDTSLSDHVRRVIVHLAFR